MYVSMNKGFVPDCIEWCNHNFVPKNDDFISCQSFGKIDIKNRVCWWCLEMLPYQWYMCSDEHNKNFLIQEGMTEQKAIAKICKMKRERMNSIRKNEKD